MQNRTLSLMSIAARGRNLVSGAFAVENAVKSGTAFLVIAGTDVSENTKKMFSNMCEFYEVPFFQFGTKETLGHAIGKEFRATLAVTDEGLAKAIVKQLEALKE